MVGPFVFLTLSTGDIATTVGLSFADLSTYACVRVVSPEKRTPLNPGE